MKAVLFDFDGTIVDSLPIILKSFEKTRELLGLDYSLETARALVGAPLIQIGEEFYGPGRGQEFVDAYSSVYKDCCEGNLHMFPGMRETIKMVRDRGVKTAIVTSKRRDSATQNLAAVEAEDLFDLLVPVEDHPKPKPYGDPVLVALEKLKVTADEAAMVGDAAFDIGTGKAANVITIGVTWGAGSRESIVAAKPDYIVDTVEELHQLLEKLIEK